MKDFVKEHDVDCEFIERMTLDVVLNGEFKDYCQAAMREAKEHGLDVSHIKYFEGEDAKKVRHLWITGSSPNNINVDCMCPSF